MPPPAAAASPGSAKEALKNDCAAQLVAAAVRLGTGPKLGGDFGSLALQMQSFPRARIAALPFARSQSLLLQSISPR